MFIFVAGDLEFFTFVFVCLSWSITNQFYIGGKKRKLFSAASGKSNQKNSVIHCLMHQATDGNRDPPRDMTYDTLRYS